MEQEINYMDFDEFREFGLLQEVNRKFFHPLGLAIEMVVDKDGKATGFGRVWDYRDDPEGMFFADGMIDQDKVDRVEKLRQSKLVKRSVDLFNCDLDGIQVK
jgi:hypothetical protein